MNDDLHQVRAHKGEYISISCGDTDYTTKGLDCDAHQAECRRLVQANRSFEVRYRTLRQIKSENIIEELRALDGELAELRASQIATVEPQWFKRH